jgi:hypothetical protein
MNVPLRRDKPARDIRTSSAANRQKAFWIERRRDRKRSRHQTTFCPSDRHLLDCATDEHSCSTQEHKLANIHGNAHGAPPTGAGLVTW